MNEEQKNIETCLAENILSEVASVPQDPQFRSLTDEALDPLKQQALRQAGYDGYEKVVWTHKPYTFTSQVKQMKSNLILLLRRLWRYPFGRGNTASSAACSSSTSAASSSSASEAAPIRSLADMWQHYITRLKGNSEYGIPSRLSQLTDLPSAPALLTDRKISGVPEAADGMSMVNLFCSGFYFTELKDENVGWTMTKPLDEIIGVLPNITKVQISASYIIGNLAKNCRNITTFDLAGVKKIKYNGYNYPFVGYFIGETFTMPNLDEVEDVSGGDELRRQYFKDCANLKTADFGTLRKFLDTRSRRLFLNCPNLENVIARNMEEFVYAVHANNGYYMFSDCPNVKKIVVGTLKNVKFPYPINFSSDAMPNLIHFEFGQGTMVDLKLQNWSPTLDDSNLQQFLSNFRDYIANRLTDNGSGLTLTLSQEVRNAIHAAEDEYGIENIIITKKGWTISPAPN